MVNVIDNCAAVQSGREAPIDLDITDHAYTRPARSKVITPMIAYTQRFKFFILTFPPKNLYYLYSIKKAEKNISPLQHKLL